jgi:hypothetical protein
MQRRPVPIEGDSSVSADLIYNRMLDTHRFLKEKKAPSPESYTSGSSQAHLLSYDSVSLVTGSLTPTLCCGL